MAINCPLGLLAALRFKQVPTIYQVKDKDRANSQMKVDVPLSVYRQPLLVIVFLQGPAHAGGVYLHLNYGLESSPDTGGWSGVSLKCYYLQNQGIAAGVHTGGWGGISLKCYYSPK